MSHISPQLRISDLPTRKPTRFALTPDAEARQRIAAELGTVDIKKLRFEGEITPVGGQDWVLSAQLGATVVQACVVTLDPVTTRIDETISRTYVAHWAEPEAGEIEMPEDDTVEPIPAVLDLATVMTESLSLALPAFPRSDGAELGEAIYAADGVTAMTDEDAKPFAGLQALKAQMDGGKDQ